MDTEVILHSRGTYACIAVVLPKCLADIVDDYILPLCSGDAARVDHHELAMLNVFSSAFNVACEVGHVEIARSMQQIYGFVGDLWYACFTGDVGIIEHILRTYRTEDEVSTARGLYGACEGGHIKIAKWMIQLCDCRRLLPVMGRTIFDAGLYRACLYGHPDLAHLMILCGATNLNQALSTACARDNINVFKMLISRGANCNCGAPPAEHIARMAGSDAEPQPSVRVPHLLTVQRGVEPL